jgi:2-oxoglutarate dehydrogenase E1 component
LYCTDVAKSVHAPIFHVNGDQPEDAVRVMRLALEWRQRFHRDVVIDLVCYRRWGHNEGDDPSYTNPVMYARIEKHRSVRKLYTEQLLRRGDIDLATAEGKLSEFQSMLQHAHDEVRGALSGKKPQARGDLEDVEGAARPSAVNTATTPEVIERVLVGLDKLPEGFEPHPKLVKQLQRRRERVETGKIEWGLAETLAFGSLVLEGTTVRLSGEDSGRGTFSQRHAKLYDHRTGQSYIPLNALENGQARFSVYDSHLSEFAVLGFEYGYAVKHPEALVMWEAQFGDFSNGAQVIIDQFLASGEEKWNQKSHVALLLPHGYEGQGPEHSSARIERFLQLSARGNWRVAYPSNPASYFHLLRRQALSPEKKPLVVFTPKSLLRMPECVSTVDDLTQQSYREVLDDPEINGKAPRRVLLCSGKVYYDLVNHRRERGHSDVAIVRLEQYYPFPAAQLTELLAGKYAKASDIVWVQEEPRNMGAWDFLDDLVRRLAAPGQTVRYIGRPVSPSPATGSLKRHQAEQQALVEEAFATHHAERAAEPRVVAVEG